MDQAQCGSRASAAFHRSKRSKRPRSDGSSYSGFNGAQASAEDCTGLSNAGSLPPGSQTQNSTTRQLDDGEPMEVSSTKSFIFKLYDMLQDKSVSAWIYWNEAGDAIEIPNIREFETKALRKHFDIKFDSFVRQLNGWSFEKIDRSKHSGRYRHKEKKFRKGCRNLLHDIKRTGPQQEKPSRQDQSASHIDAQLNPEPWPQPNDRSDLHRKVFVLEQENMSLREAVKNLEMKTEAMEARFDALSRVVHGLSKASSQIQTVPALPVNPPVAPYGNHLEAVANTGQRHPIQVVHTHSISTGELWTSPEGSRPPVNSTATQYPIPTTILSLHNSYPTVQRSPPSASVRLPDDPYSSHLFPSSATTSGQNWQGFSGPYQQALRDSSAPSMVSVQNNPTNTQVGNFQQGPSQNAYYDAPAQLLPDFGPSTSRFIHHPELNRHPIPESASLHAYPRKQLDLHEGSAFSPSTFPGGGLYHFYATNSDPIAVERRQIVGTSHSHVPQTVMQSTPGTLPIGRSPTYPSHRTSGTVAQVPSRHTESGAASQL